MKRQYVETVQVFRLARSGPRALLVAGTLRMPCRIGRNGATHVKREGDGKSPCATMAILGGYWRADRRLPPRSGLELTPSRMRDGWCDAPGHRNYNRPVRLPFAASHEEMQRQDGQYDVVLDLDWNRRRRVQGHGSAIFLHLMADGGTGTAGCVAVPAGHINRLMAVIGPHTRVRIS